MKLKSYQLITLIVVIVFTLSTIGVILSGILVNAMANSDSSPFQISLRDTVITPTPFQPSSFANILEDGTIELIPQPMYTPTPVPTIPVAELPKKQLNILLLGTDDTKGMGFRTDVIMLLSVSPQHGTATLVSFPRDLYVTIPGYWSNRINTVWGLGGFDLLVDTFEVNFGIRPEFYMMVNYNGFKDVVDSLGGIDVKVTQELQDSCKIDPSGWCVIKPGKVHMNGGLALWYSRARMTTSDFDRNRRAQDVVKAIVKKAISLDMLTKVPKMYGFYRKYVDTNVPLKRLLRFVPMANDVINDNGIRHFKIGPESVYDWITAEGAMVLLPNNYAIEEILSEALYRNK